jgi:hypothetical protein
MAQAILAILLASAMAAILVGRRANNALAKHLELASPMMRRSTSLNPNQAWWQLLEEREDLATLQMPADHHPTSSINAMNLKD